MKENELIYTTTLDDQFPPTLFILISPAEPLYSVFVVSFLFPPSAIPRFHRICHHSFALSAFKLGLLWTCRVYLLVEICLLLGRYYILLTYSAAALLVVLNPFLLLYFCCCLLDTYGISYYYSLCTSHTFPLSITHAHSGHY